MKPDKIYSKLANFISIPMLLIFCFASIYFSIYFTEILNDSNKVAVLIISFVILLALAILRLMIDIRNLQKLTNSTLSGIFIRMLKKLNDYPSFLLIISLFLDIGYLLFKYNMGFDSSNYNNMKLMTTLLIFTCTGCACQLGTDQRNYRKKRKEAKLAKEDEVL